MKTKQELIAQFEDAQRTNVSGICGVFMEDVPTIIQSLQQSEWISVEERLPEYNQYCLITYPKAPIPLTAIYKGESSWLGIDTEIWLAKEDITFWMPLPTPPNK
jgi:hypothetical protein